VTIVLNMRYRRCLATAADLTTAGQRLSHSEQNAGSLQCCRCGDLILLLLEVC